MVSAARVALAFKAGQLREVLETSRKRLAPLDDPLCVDLGLHRWLEADREEAYSDWLHWVVLQLSRADYIYRLFGLEPPPGWEAWGSKQPEVAREVCVTSGHLGHGGRLDLLIRYSGHAILIIEVKKADADEADTAKHKGYGKWLSEQPEPKANKQGVLLATWAKEEEYDGFDFCSWASVCVALRQLVPELGDDVPTLSRALLLAFVGAVEQNLLGFSGKVARQIISGELALFNSQIIDHLKQATGRTRHEPAGAAFDG
jgi:hypothetical protein